jgi:hypothetical protein
MVGLVTVAWIMSLASRAVGRLAMVTHSSRCGLLICRPQCGLRCDFIQAIQRQSYCGWLALGVPARNFRICFTA